MPALAEDLLVQVEGPAGDFGQALVRAAAMQQPEGAGGVGGGGGGGEGGEAAPRRRATFTLKPWFSAGGGGNSGGGGADNARRIAVETRTAPGGVRVSYVPRSTGRHQVSLMCRGRHIAESPYTVDVDMRVGAASEAPDFTEPWWAAGGGAAETSPRRDGRRVRVVYRVVDFVTEKMLLTADGKLQKIPPNASSRLLRALSLPDLFAAKTTADSAPQASDSSDSETFYDSQSDVGSAVGCTSPSETPVKPRYYPKEGKKEDERKESPKREEGRKSPPRSPPRPVRDPEFFRKKYRKVVHMCRFLVNHTLNKRSLEILSAAGRLLDGRPVRLTSEMESLLSQVMTSQLETASTKPQLAALAEEALDKNQQPHSSDDAPVGLNSVPELLAWEEPSPDLPTLSRREPDEGSEADLCGAQKNITQQPKPSACDRAVTVHFPEEEDSIEPKKDPPPRATRDKPTSVRFRSPLLTPSPSPSSGLNIIAEIETPEEEQAVMMRRQQTRTSTVAPNSLDQAVSSTPHSPHELPITALLSSLSSLPTTNTSIPTPLLPTPLPQTPLLQIDNTPPSSHFLPITITLPDSSTLPILPIPSASPTSSTSPITPSSPISSFSFMSASPPNTPTTPVSPTSPMSPISSASHVSHMSPTSPALSVSPISLDRYSPASPSTPSRPFPQDLCEESGPQLLSPSGPPTTKAIPWSADRPPWATEERDEGERGRAAERATGADGRSGERSPPREAPQSKQPPASAPAPPASRPIARDAPRETRPSRPIDDDDDKDGEEPEDGINLQQTVSRSGPPRPTTLRLEASVMSRPSGVNIRAVVDDATTEHSLQAAEDAPRYESGRSKEEGQVDRNTCELMSAEVDADFFSEYYIQNTSHVRSNKDNHEKSNVVTHNRVVSLISLESESSELQESPSPSPQSDNICDQTSVGSFEWQYFRENDGFKKYFHDQQENKSNKGAVLRDEELLENVLGQPPKLNLGQHPGQPPGQHSGQPPGQPVKEPLEKIRGQYSGQPPGGTSREPPAITLMESPNEEADSFPIGIPQRSPERTPEQSPRRSHSQIYRESLTQPSDLSAGQSHEQPRGSPRSKPEPSSVPSWSTRGDPPREPAPPPPTNPRRTSSTSTFPTPTNSASTSSRRAPNLDAVLSASSLEEALARYEQELQEVENGGSPGTTSSGEVPCALEVHARGGSGGDDNSPQGRFSGSIGTSSGRSYDRGDSDYVSMEDIRSSLHHSPESAPLGEDSGDDWTRYLTIDYDPEHIGPAEREIWDAMEKEQENNRPVTDWVSNLMPSNRFHPRVLSPGTYPMDSIREESEDRSATPGSPISPSFSPQSVRRAMGSTPFEDAPEEFPSFFVISPSPVDDFEDAPGAIEEKQNENITNEQNEIMDVGCLIDFTEGSSPQMNTLINVSGINSGVSDDSNFNANSSSELLLDPSLPVQDNPEEQNCEVFQTFNFGELNRSVISAQDQKKCDEGNVCKETKRENEVTSSSSGQSAELNEFIELSRSDVIGCGDTNITSQLCSPKRLIEFRSSENSYPDSANIDVILWNTERNQRQTVSSKSKALQQEELIKISPDKDFDRDKLNASVKTFNSTENKEHTEIAVVSDDNSPGISSEFKEGTSLERIEIIINGNNEATSSSPIPTIFIQDEDLRTFVVTSSRNSPFESIDEGESVEDVFNTLIREINDENLTSRTSSVGESSDYHDDKNEQNFESQNVLSECSLISVQESDMSCSQINVKYEADSEDSYPSLSSNLSSNIIIPEIIFDDRSSYTSSPDITELKVPTSSPSPDSTKSSEQHCKFSEWPSKPSSDIVPLTIRVTQWKQFWDQKATSQKRKDEHKISGVQRSIKKNSNHLDLFKGCHGAPNSPTRKRLHPSIRIPGIVNKWRQSFENVVEANKVAKEFLKYRPIKKRKSILKYHNRDDAQTNIGIENVATETTSTQPERVKRVDFIDETSAVNSKPTVDLKEWPQSNLVISRKQIFESECDKTNDEVIAQQVDKRRPEYFQTIPPRRKTTKVAECLKFWDGISKGQSCDELSHLCAERSLMVTQEIFVDDIPVSNSIDVMSNEETSQKTDQVSPATEIIRRVPSDRNSNRDSVTSRAVQTRTGIDVWNHTDRVPVTFPEENVSPTPGIPKSQDSSPRRTPSPAPLAETAAAAVIASSALVLKTDAASAVSSSRTEPEPDAEVQPEVTTEAVTPGRRLHMVAAEEMWYRARRIPIEEVEGSSGSEIDDPSPSLDDSTDLSWSIVEEGAESQADSPSGSRSSSRNVQRPSAARDAASTHTRPPRAAAPSAAAAAKPPRADREARSRFENAKLFFQALEQGSQGGAAVATGRGPWGRRRGRGRHRGAGRRGTDLDTTSTDDTGSECGGSGHLPRMKRRGSVNARPSAAHSAPASDSETFSRLSVAAGDIDLSGADRHRTQRHLSDRFLVSGLFRDVSGGGVPHRREMLAALAAVDSRPVSPYEGLEAAEAAAPEDDASALAAAPLPRAYDADFPYLPATDPRLVRPRATLKGFALGSARVVGFDDV